MSQLFSISPIDGRYRNKVSKLENYFSEFALIKYRVKVEIEYFIELSNTIKEVGKLSTSQKESLRNIYLNFIIHTFHLPFLSIHIC